MKKLFLISILMALMFSVKAQIPNQQPIGSINTENHALGAYGTNYGIRFRTSYADTAALNLAYGGLLKNIPGFMARVVDDIYVRNNAATKWNIQSGGGGAGTVTDFTAGNLSPLFTSSVANSTTTPALTFAQVSQNQNLVFASPNGSSGNPTFRSLVAADLPSLTVPISSLTAATGSNSIDNLGYEQSWDWSTLTSGGSGLRLQSEANTAATGGEDVLRVSMAANPIATGITTYAADFDNQSSGTNLTNVGLRASATSGTTNIALWANRGSVNLGTVGTESGVLNFNGSTSGTITIQPQAAAGTYNFNLPTTAGTSGYLLTSAGGGGTAMTWTAPSALYPTLQEVFDTEVGGSILTKADSIVTTATDYIILGNSEGPLVIAADDVGNQMLVLRGVGDAAYRFGIQGDGHIEWTDGTGANYGGLKPEVNGIATLFGPGTNTRFHIASVADTSTVSFGSADTAYVASMYYDNTNSRFGMITGGNLFVSDLATGVGDKAVRWNSSTKEFTVADTTTGGGAVAWNAITSPTADQALTFDAGESSTWTDANTTEDLFTVNSSTGTTNSMFSLNRTGTALAAGNNILELVSSGANGTNAITATGLRVSVTNTNGTSGTNIGAAFTASGATTANYSAQFTGAIVPGTNDGSAIGTTGLQWSDLFLAEGGVINFDNGDVTMTQSGNNLTVAGGAFIVTNAEQTPASFTSTFAGNMQVNWNSSTGNNVNFVFQDAGTARWYIGNNSATGSDRLHILNASAAEAVTVLQGLQVGINNTAPTARLHIGAGAAVATYAPLKMTSGPLLPTPEAGAMEFLTDKWYGTITTGAARKEFVMTDNAIGGNILFTDNTYDIGASGATRPRTGYFGTSIFDPILYGSSANLAGATGLTISSTSAAGAANKGIIKIGTFAAFDEYYECVGIGLQNSVVPLHIKGSSTTYNGLKIENTNSGSYARQDWVNNNGDLTQMLLAGSAYNSGIFTANSASFFNNGAGGTNIGGSHATTGHIRFFTRGTGTVNEKIRISSIGNLLIGGTADPTSSVAGVAIFNGTAPTASVTDGTILYSEDVTASSELKVRDEAGNITVLSPHNFSQLGKPSEDLAWSYYSEKDGKYITVDMAKAIRTIEDLSERVSALEKELNLKAKPPVKLLYKGKVKKK